MSLPPNLPPKTSNKTVTPGVRTLRMKDVPTRRILLEENSDIPPVGLFLSHNGRTFMLKPGEWVDAPLPLIEILDNAVTSVPELDPVTKGIISWRPRLRFPYRNAPGQGREAA